MKLSNQFVDGMASAVERQKKEEAPGLYPEPDIEALLRRCVLAIEGIHDGVAPYADADEERAEGHRVHLWVGVLDAKELYDAYHAAVNVVFPGHPAAVTPNEWFGGLGEVEGANANPQE